MAVAEVGFDAVGPLHRERGLSDPGHSGENGDQDRGRLLPAVGEQIVEDRQFLGTTAEAVRGQRKLCRDDRPGPDRSAVGPLVAAQQVSVHVAQFGAGIGAEFVCQAPAHRLVPGDAVISGDFDRNRAGELTALIGNGVLPVRLVIASVESVR